MHSHAYSVAHAMPTIILHIDASIMFKHYTYTSEQVHVWTVAVVVALIYRCVRAHEGTDTTNTHMWKHSDIDQSARRVNVKNTAQKMPMSSAALGTLSFALLARHMKVQPKSKLPQYLFVCLCVCACLSLISQEGITCSKSKDQVRLPPISLNFRRNAK